MGFDDIKENLRQDLLGALANLEYLEESGGMDGYGAPSPAWLEELRRRAGALLDWL